MDCPICRNKLYSNITPKNKRELDSIYYVCGKCKCLIYYSWSYKKNCYSLIEISNDVNPYLNVISDMKFSTP